MANNKRPDGVSLIPYRRGKCIIWDATVRCTLAQSYVGATSRQAGAAANAAERLKRRTYAQFAPQYEIVPLAFETHGSLSESTASFLKDLARRISQETGDQRAGTFFMQRLGLAIQRGNAICVLGSMGALALEE